MKIIETRQAPNPRRVRIFLAEKGIEIEYEEISIMTGEQRSDAFTAINPMQRVPVLVLDDGTAIAETVAICRYFEEQQPKPALMGEGALGRATVEMWQRRMESDLLWTVGNKFRHTNPRALVLEDPQIAQWGEVNEGRVMDFLKILDAQLADRPFVAGDNYSIADITGLCAIDFMNPAQIELPPEHTNVARWYGELAARPSAQA
jgi:glutathione S-transferase